MSLLEVVNVGQGDYKSAWYHYGYNKTVQWKTIRI